MSFLEQTELSFYYCRLCESMICELAGNKAPEFVKGLVNDHF